MARTVAEDLDPVVDVADHLDAASFALTVDPEAARRDAATLAQLLRSAVARDIDPDAPLLVVVAGGSGAGKSTTVNTIARTPVAAVSVVRPTTRAPVLVAHPGDVDRVAGGRLLADLPRVRGADDHAGVGSRLVVRTADALPPGLTLLDTPDVDSVELANHRLAEDALVDADVWLWFVTARTYADEVGARWLRTARDRGTAVGVVVTQVRPEDDDEVVADVRRLLADEGVGVDLLATIAHVEVEGDLLPPAAAEAVETYLRALAAPEARAAARRRAVDGIRTAMPALLAPVTRILEDAVQARDRLAASVDAAYDPVLDDLAVELDHGIPLRADVLARWRDLVGSSDLAVRVRSVTDRMRGAVQDLLGSDRHESPRQVRTEVAGEVTGTVDRLLERARADARRRFERDPIGRRVLDDRPDLRHDDAEARLRRIRAAVDAWGEQVAERVATIGAERATRARRWSTALNAVATSAILVVFAASGGLTGGEVGIAALASAASQTLLVKLFGEQNLRRLLEEIRADLDRRVAELVVQDRADLDGALADAAPDTTTVDTIVRAGRSGGRP